MIKLVFLILLVLTVASPHPVSGETTVIYAIQAGSFKDLQKATKKTEHLKEKGLEAFWKEEQPAGKGKRYLVYIGNYESREEAREEAKRLKQEGVLVDYSIKALEPDSLRGPTREQKAPAPTKAESDLVISEITFKLKSPGKEMVRIQGSRSFAPSAFAIEGDKPRFVIDIKDTGPVKRELSRIAADGQFIEGIRTFYHRQNRTLRIVLDLQPSKSYRISQFFYQGENIYAVEVEAK
jgi:hypothetical protein